MAFTPKNWQNLPSTISPISAAALIDLETRLTAYTDSLPLITSIVGVAAPTAVAVTDETNIQTAFTSVASGGCVLFQPGLYATRPTSGGVFLVPNNVTVIIPAGTTIQVPANTTTANHQYNLFVGVSDPQVNIHYVIDGVIDGNIANGNHNAFTPAGEFIFAINISDAQGCSITGGGKICNWRSEAIVCERSTSTTQRLVINGGLQIVNCGVKQGGDGGNPRQGISIQSGKDVWIDDVHFDTIGAYAIDFETSGGGDSLDNCGVGPNCTFRNVGANGPGGNVNFSNAAGGTINPNCHVYPSPASGTLPTTNLYVVPTNVARKVVVRRNSGDLTLNSNTRVVVPGAWDIVMPAQPGDFIRYEPNFGLGTVADFTSFDVATIVSAAIVNWFSSGGNVADSTGIPGWRYQNTGKNGDVSGAAWYGPVVLADLSNGLITLRPYYNQVNGTNQTLFASSGGAQGTRASVMAENLGPGW